MPVWMTQLLALTVLVGIISLCFWKARGVKPRKGNTDNLLNYFKHPDLH